MSTKILPFHFHTRTPWVRSYFIAKNPYFTKASISPLWIFLSVFIHGLILLGLTGFFSRNEMTKNEIINIDLNISHTNTSNSISQKNKNISVPKPHAITKIKNSDPTISSSTSKSEEINAPAFSDNISSSIVTQTGNNGDVKSIYIAELIRKIEANKIYPYMAKKLRQSGKVVVKLEILKSGQIVSQSVIQSSPHNILNQAALRLVASLKSVSPIPEELHLESWQVIVPIAYVLR